MSTLLDFKCAKRLKEIREHSSEHGFQTAFSKGLNCDCKEEFSLSRKLEKLKRLQAKVDMFNDEQMMMTTDNNFDVLPEKEEVEKEMATFTGGPSSKLLRTSFYQDRISKMPGESLSLIP